MQGDIERDLNSEPKNATDSTIGHGPAPVESQTRLEPFQMRCPNCRKLYSVGAHLLSKNSETVSRFDCVSCQTSFLAVMPTFAGPSFLETRLLETELAPLGPLADLRSDFINSDFIETRDPQAPPTNVRAIEEARLNRSTQMAQAQVAAEIEFSGSRELVSMWAAVMADYENESLHEAFLNRCRESQQLAYATHKYAQILVSAPQEEIARKMRKKAMGFASYGFDVASPGLSKTSWTFPLPSFNSFIILLGTIAVVIGLGFPNSGHTAGLGFAMIALALCLRFFLRRPTI